jgi:hypothetical protein
MFEDEKILRNVIEHLKEENAKLKLQLSLVRKRSLTSYILNDARTYIGFGFGVATALFAMFF